MQKPRHQFGGSATAFTILSTFIPWLYLAWTIGVAIVWVSGAGPATVQTAEFAKAVPNHDLRRALEILLGGIDPIWLILGATCLYLGVVSTEGLASARRWFSTTMVTGVLVSGLSALMSVPLGPITYTAKLGWKAGPIPFGIPFIWIVIVIGAREALLFTLKRAPYEGVAVGVGLLSGMLSWFLEPVAWKYRAWWLWSADLRDGTAAVPWSSHLTWAVAGFIIAILIRPTAIARNGPQAPMVKSTVYVSFCAVIVLTYFLK